MPDHQTRFASLESGQLDVIFMDRGHIIKRAGENGSLVHIQGESNGAEIAFLRVGHRAQLQPCLLRVVVAQDAIEILLVAMPPRAKLIFRKQAG